MTNSSVPASVTTSASTPLTREEATMFFMTLMDGLKSREDRFMEHVEEIIRRNSDAIQEAVAAVENQSANIRQVAEIIRASTESSNSAVDKQESQVLELINKATAANTEAIRAIREAVSSIKMPDVRNVAPIQNVNVFNNTALLNDISIWKSQQKGLVEDMARKGGAGAQNAWNAVYDEMATGGFDVKALQREYMRSHGQTSLIDMCANSDILRRAFELSVRKVYTQYSSSSFIKGGDTPKPVVKSIPAASTAMLVKSEQQLSTPDDLKELVEPYMPMMREWYKIDKFPFALVYQQMKKDFGTDLAAIKEEYVKSGKLKKYCSSGWIVHFDESLKSQFRESLVNMMKKRYPKCL